MTAGRTGQVAVGDLEAGADRLDGEVEGAVEVGGRRRHHDLVVGRPDRHPQRAGGRLVAGVELAEQLAVGQQLLARLGARVRGDVGAQTGQVGAVVRRADRDDPAGQAAAAVVARPRGGDDAAGGVPDHVDRPGAVRCIWRTTALSSASRLLVEVAGAVAGQVDDHHRPALRPQRVGQHLQRGGAAVVARHEQHRSRLSWDTGRTASSRLAHTAAPTPTTATSASTARPSTNRRRAGESPSSTSRSWH